MKKIEDVLKEAGIKSSYVKHGTKVRCSYALIESILYATSTRGVILKGKPMLIVTDRNEVTNIMSFGVCSSPKNPAVQKEAEKILQETRGSKNFREKTRGFFKDEDSKRDEEVLKMCVGKCQALIKIDWIDGKDDVLIKGEKALLSTSKLSCIYGGEITIVTDLDYEEIEEEVEEEIIKEEGRVSARGPSVNINRSQVAFPLDGGGLPSVSIPSAEISLGGMEYNTPTTTPISNMPANINTYVSVGDVNVGGSIGVKNTGVSAMASAVTGGRARSVDVGNVRVTAGIEGHLLAKGGTKQVSTERNEEGKLNAIELEIGKSFGVGATGKGRVERIDPNIEEPLQEGRTTEEKLLDAISGEPKDND